MNLEGTVLIAKIWCLDAKLKDIGVESLLWLDFAIDLKEVIAIKINGEGDTEGEKEGENKSSLYTRDTSFTVDVDYEELLPVWVKIKTQE